MEIHLLIKSIAYERGLNIRDLSEKSDIPYPTLRRFLNDGKEISCSKLITVLTSLGIDLKRLILEDSDCELGFIKSSIKDIKKAVKVVKQSRRR